MTNYQLLQNFHYSLSDLDYMIPWEREVYVTLLVEFLKEEEERIKAENARR